MAGRLDLEAGQTTRDAAREFDVHAAVDGEVLGQPYTSGPSGYEMHSSAIGS